MRTFGAVVLAYLCIFAIGDALLSLCRGYRLKGGERLALDFALGVGGLSLFLFWAPLLSAGRVGFGWALPLALICALLCCSPLGWLARLHALARPGSTIATPHRPSGLTLLVLGFEICCGLVNALATPPVGDGLTFWTPKAQLAFMAGRVPLSYLTDPSRQWAHQDYPWLLPLTEAWFYYLTGHASVVLTKLVCASFFAVLLISLYFGLRRSLQDRTSLTVTALVGAIPSLVVWSSTGYADTTVSLYWLTSVIYLYHWLQTRAREDLSIATMLVTLAVWTKHEGLVYWSLQTVVVLIASVRSNGFRKALSNLGLFAGISGIVLVPWLTFLGLFHLQSYDFSAVSPQTTLAGLDRLPVIVASVLRELANPMHWVLLWVVFAVAVVLLILRPGNVWWLRAYLALSAAVPIVVFSLGYMYSTWQPVTDHIKNSMERLALQQAPAATVFVVLQFREQVALWQLPWWPRWLASP